MPVSLAVFKRQNKLWIVFDHSQQIDIKELRNMAGDLAENIFQFPHPGATIIQLTPKEDVQFFVRKEGLLWIVDLFTSDQKPQPVKDMTIFTQYDSLNRPYLFIPTEAAGNIVSVIDPDVGDIITVAPTGSAGYGLNAPYHYYKIYTVIALVFIFLGTLASNDLVWELSDMFNQLMVIPNVIALFALTKMVQGCTKGLKADR